MIYRKTIIFILLAVMTIAMAGCGESKSSGSSSAGNSESESAQTKTTVSMDSIFAAYHKVSLDQTKEQVDAELGAAGEESSEVPNTYSYVDKSTGYGVSVLYDDSKVVIAKTVIYNSHSELAPFCKESVTEKQADQIANDMTYEQVKELLGGDGIEICVSELAAGDQEQSLIRRWANDDGSCLDVYFRSDDTVSNSYFFSN